MEFNQTGAYETATAIFNGTDPTSTQFSVGTNSNVNASGGTYVAYLFAHHANDGSATGFGPDGDSPVISCQSFTGGTTGTEVNVGFEPQFVMIKRAVGGTGDWMMFDAMRGVVSDPYPNLDNTLFANLNNAERTNTGYIGFTPTGFIHQGGSGDTNTNGDTYIYMAIRRGPLAAPDDATKVFNIGTYGANRNSSTTDTYYAGFPVDMALKRVPVTSTANSFLSTRMLGTTDLKTNSTDAERTGETEETWDSNTHWNSAAGTSTTSYSWMWRRSPGFMDVVAYTGNDTAGRTVNHNLGVTPEMMWIKGRSAAYDWVVYHEAIGNSKILNLNGTVAGYTQANFNNTDPTSSVFTVGSIAGTNASSQTFIAYLFATLAGISKVGSYTGNDSSQTIDCGFTSGARFVLIKSVTQTQPWFLFDSARGIVAGNDPYLQLQSTVAQNELGAIDVIDPHSSGFIVNTQMGGINDNNETYIFYAIA